ncbi:hydrogenase iron-sulfur subunit [Chloroflexota bacterium]
MTNFEPKIVIFRCNWGAEADLASTSSNQNPRIIRTMCSGRIAPTFILSAFSNGADGVMITGCHPGDCHYNTGNYKTMRRVMLLKNMLPQFGIEPERLRLERISATEASKSQSAMHKFIDKVTKLGPLGLNKKVKVN